MNYKLYILHGWAYSTKKWQPFIDLLKQKGINPILLKIPGLTEKIYRPWTIDDYVQWLKNKIVKEKYKIIVIGHSNGGRIALNFAIKYPNSIDRLVLIDSAGIYHEDLVIRGKRLIFKNIAKIAKKFSSSENLKKLLYKIVGESDYRKADPLMRKTMINLIDSDKKLALDKIIVPTLIIWGENDTTTPLSDGKIMHKVIKKSKLSVIKGAKHSPQFTHAREVAEIILKNFNLKFEIFNEI